MNIQHYSAYSICTLEICVPKKPEVFKCTSLETNIAPGLYDLEISTSRNERKKLHHSQNLGSNSPVEGFDITSQ